MTRKAAALYPYSPKPYMIGSLSPKALKYEPFEGKGYPYELMLRLPVWCLNLKRFQGFISS